MDARINKLPAWARHEFARLATRVKQLQEALGAATGKVPTRVSFGTDYSTMEPLGFLRELDKVQFELSGEERGPHIQFRLEDLRRVRVQGSGRLIVRPVASNVIELEVEP